MFGQAATQRGQGREAVQAGLQARGITNSGLRGKAMARTDADYAGSALQTIEQARDADLQGKALRQQGILNLQNQWVSMITGLSDARLLGTAQANQQHVIDDKNTGAGIKGLITAGTLAAGGVQGAAAVNSQQGGGGGYPGQGQNYLGQGQQLQQNQDWYGQRYGNVPNNRRL